MRKFCAALILSVSPTLALAQTSGGVDVASLRSPFVAGPVYSVKVQTESLSATTGRLVANANQTKDLGVFNPLTDSVLLAEISGPKTAGAKTIVAAIKATFTVTGLLGADAEPAVLHIKLPNVELPAGQTLAIRYDMPILPPGKMQWKVAVGARAADIPTPVAPGPVASGPITPAPIPAPAPVPVTPVVPSPAPGAPATGTAMPPAASLTDAAGLVWTMAAPDPKCEGGALQAMQRNGVSVGSGQSMKACNGVVWGLGGGTTWYQGTSSSSCGGSGWVNARGTAPC